jgi:hypothetical protein
MEIHGFVVLYRESNEMRPRMVKLGWVGALAVALGVGVLGQNAKAGAVVGSESLAGTVTAPTGAGADITTTGSVSFSGFVDTGGSGGTDTGDFQTFVPGFTSIPGAETLTLALGPNSFTISSAAWGTFLATDLVKDTIGTNVRTDYINGNFTPGTLFGGETASTATLIIAFTQAGGVGDAISASLTLVTPALSVPEPSSFAIMGSLALIGVVVGIRRNRKVGV